jgi:hypothetical protein
VTRALRCTLVCTCDQATTWSPWSSNVTNKLSLSGRDVSSLNPYGGRTFKATRPTGRYGGEAGRGEKGGGRIIQSMREEEGKRRKGGRELEHGGGEREKEEEEGLFKAKR